MAHPPDPPAEGGKPVVWKVMVVIVYMSAVSWMSCSRLITVEREVGMSRYDSEYVWG